MKESLGCISINLADSSHRKPCCTACRREPFLWLSIATRPNSCRTNPGINRVSEVAFTSDCILLCVRGSQTVLYKPLPSAVPAWCCSCGSWIESQFIKQHQVKSMKCSGSLVRLHIPARGVLEGARCAVNQGWGRSQLHVMPKHRPEDEKFPLLILCSCCHCWQWYLSLPGVTKSSKRKFGQCYFWPQIRNGGSREVWKINGES